MLCSVTVDISGRSTVLRLLCSLHLLLSSTERKIFLEMLVDSPFNHLTQLLFRGSFIEFSRRGSFT